MNALIIVFCLTITSIGTISNAKAQVSDLPRIIILCDDNISDGGKFFQILENQFGTLSAKIIQNDQFTGARIITKFPSVRKVECSGY